jgi:uncharacterized paraquat-inducible protein A
VSKELITGHAIVCAECSVIFTICKACYRGHLYCSVLCRATGYRRSRKRARAKYALSAEGREGHRDRQKIYRKKRKTHLNSTLNFGQLSLSVTDQSSKQAGLVVTLPTNSKHKIAHCIVCGLKISAAREFSKKGNEDLELFTVPPD